jgi:ubiquinone/menaquinone biosynthesis C-methylase UbiE
MFSYFTFHRFFSRIQENSWYLQFLEPVLSEVGEGKVLDIGTGSGKLLQMLASKKHIFGTGIDTNEGMLAEARKKLNGLEVPLVKIETDEQLPFAADTFDYVTICNVLFNLDDKSSRQLLLEAVRLVKPNGKIVILTPSGHKDWRRLIRMATQDQNPSIFLWYAATRQRGKQWNRKSDLQGFASTHKLIYRKKTVFNDFATLETLSH